MQPPPDRARQAPDAGGEPNAPARTLPMAVVSPAASVPGTPSRPPPPAEPRALERGLVLFDLDGTLLDDLGLISAVAADVMHTAFGTAPEEARVHYLATTGLPFEAQLAQLYPDAPGPERSQAARTFHQRKITEAYAQAKPFPEVPKLLRRLAGARWTLAITTGGETEMAELILEREGLRYWFEDVLGSGQGTKREHLVEYRRRYPEAAIFLVGDSRFDMEVTQTVRGVTALGRATSLPGWTLSPRDLQEWGAAWADYRLDELPEALEQIERGPRAKRARRAPPPRRRRP